MDSQKDGLAWIEDSEHPEAGAGDFEVFPENVLRFFETNVSQTVSSMKSSTNSIKTGKHDTYPDYDKDKWQEPIGGYR